jgi:hypothetical protein
MTTAISKSARVTRLKRLKRFIAAIPNPSDGSSLFLVTGGLKIRQANAF